MLSVLLVSLAAVLARADYGNNVNFGSPSLDHPALGIDMHKVMKRSASPADSPQAFADSSKLNFTHGVASGDPRAQSVVLWTRAAPTAINDGSNATVTGVVEVFDHSTQPYIDADPNPICVSYVVADDEKLTNVVTKGTAYTVSDIDYTVKVIAEHLKPFTTYWYQFTICDSEIRSPIGRTKTSPSANDAISNVSLAVFSCSNLPNGFFNAYGNAARKDNVDYFVHLGDYIYESALTSNKNSQELLREAGRVPNPTREIVTLYDYRTRHAQYRNDTDLRLAHQNFAWIPVANNGYRDGFSNMNNTEDSFLKFGGISADVRKMNAVRAYFEWIPIRQVSMDDNLRIWRQFKLGNLVDLILLDTRYYDRSITSLGWNDDYVIDDLRNDTARSMMGSRQESWFYRKLSESNQRGATWRLIGSQTVFSRINSTSNGQGFSGDSWEGYIGNRNRTLNHLYRNNITNNVFIAGDSHQNWVSDLTWLDTKPYDEVTGEGAVGVEFAGTAVSSTGQGGLIANANEVAQGLVDDNRELKWQEGYYRGYIELHFSPQELRAQYYGAPTVSRQVPYDISLANFTVTAGAGHLARPIAGGRVESGALQTATGGDVVPTNVTLNTINGTYFVHHEDQMFIVPDH